MDSNAPALLGLIRAQRDELEHNSSRLEAVLAAVPGGIVLVDDPLLASYSPEPFVAALQEIEERIYEEEG